MESPRASATSDADRAEDVRRACQAVLDARELAQYLTPAHGEVPVHLVPSGPCNGLDLEKHGRPVSFDGAAGALTITDVLVQGSRARASLRYDREGVHGELELERSGEGFRVVTGRVVER